MGKDRADLAAVSDLLETGIQHRIVLFPLLSKEWIVFDESQSK